MEQAIQITKKKAKTKHKVGSRSSLRLRRQVLPSLVGLVPCYTLSAVSLLSSTVVSLLPPRPFRLCASRIRAARGSELFFSSFACHVGMNRSAASRILRCYLLAFFAAWTRSTVSTPDCRAESSVERSVDQETARSSLRVLSQLFGGPPGPGFFPPAICANIIRLGNRSLFCRTVAPAKKSRRLRVVVSILSQFVFLRALADERLVWWCGSRDAGSRGLAGELRETDA